MTEDEVSSGNANRRLKPEIVRQHVTGTCKSTSAANGMRHGDVNLVSLPK